MEMPVLRELRPGHQVACHFPEEIRRSDDTIVGPQPPDVRMPEGEPQIDAPSGFVSEIVPAAQGQVPDDVTPMENPQWG